MSRWVDFRQLRESLQFPEVLQAYGVNLTEKGEQALGFCPLPEHKGQSKQKSKSFSVNLARGIFQCFGCQAKGNVLDFAVMMEGFDPSDREQFRKGALRVQERFGESSQEAVPQKEAPRPQPQKPEERAACVVNAPLDFELRSIEQDHEYFRKRGLTPKTVAHFGLGYCKRGLMKGRVVIPLHDSAGQLIGYAGRLVDDNAIADDEPKYRLPGRRERSGMVYEFHKSEFLFNGYRLKAPVEEVVVVEGFFGAMWVHQAGHENVVALMGSTCSGQQRELLAQLVKPDGRVWLMPDGDQAGQKCGMEVLPLLGERRFVRWVKLPDGKEPEDFAPRELDALLGREV